MITEETKYNVKNRSTSLVTYRIPETNVRREFQPGETKQIPFGELEKLTYQPGGRELLENFLQIVTEEVTESLNINREPEYNMSEAQVKDLLLTGSYDAFLDALDFAPLGVIDLIKSLAVALPLQDMQKRVALKEKTGFDVDKAIANKQAEEAETAAEKTESTTAKTRRTSTTTTSAGRRTSSKYEIVE